MALRGARILSSCNEASNKQEQNMSVNIKVEDKMPQQTVQPSTIQQIIQQPLSSGPHSIQQTIEQSPYVQTEGPRLEEARQLSQGSIQQTITQPTVQRTYVQPTVQPTVQRTYVQPEGPVYVQPTVQPTVQPINFTTAEQQLPTTTTTTTPTSNIGNGSLTPQPEILTYPSIVPQMQNSTPTGVLSRDIDLEKDLQIQDLETKNKFLTLMLKVYQNNPLYINSYVVCESKVLMDMIKLLTGCEKVDLVLNDDLACSGCGANSKLIYISKILITKDGKTEEFKHAYNDIYSKFISYGISLKVVY